MRMAFKLVEAQGSGAHTDARSSNLHIRSRYTTREAVSPGAADVVRKTPARHIQISIHKE
jgi:hypothetical protein